MKPKKPKAGFTKAGLRQEAFRPMPKIREAFTKKQKAMWKEDGYSTKDRILNELYYMWTYGSIKLSWEK